ncbi:MAG TPA: PQQ-binding-like beta-propeller repeat protein [Pirellulaceae bacterium]|nr:PQQ-binding-like beta-propeller repeat protein [Pirellulaceae bacterium]
MNLPTRTFTIALAIGTLFPAFPARADNWPQWRGPDGTGVSQEKDLPIVWHEGRGIDWKSPLPAWGTSTPAIWGDAIFVTSHTDKNELLLLKLHKKSGEILWTQNVGSGEARRDEGKSKGPSRDKQKFHLLHNLASPSPVTDGKTVVAHFGNGDLAAYDYDGKQLWKRNLQEDYGGYSIWWGHANSPVLYRDLVISVCMQDSLADLRDKPVESYLVAHDLKSGNERWKLIRTTKAKAEECDAYTTPLLVRRDSVADGAPRSGDLRSDGAPRSGDLQLVIMGGNQLDAYDPATGKQLWVLEGLVGGRTVTGPTAAHGLIYATRGLRGAMVAVDPSAGGELSKRSIVWEYEGGTPDTCCPVVWAELLFMVSDDGIARCLDARTRHLKWMQRLKGKYKASPIAAEGRVFFLNTEGLCTVISAAPRFDKLLENKLDDEFLASPAVSDGKIFLRGKNTLYCIGR